MRWQLQATFAAKICLWPQSSNYGFSIANLWMIEKPLPRVPAAIATFQHSCGKDQ
jgi:hypothetical protein